VEEAESPEGPSDEENTAGLAGASTNGEERNAARDKDDDGAVV